MSIRLVYGLPGMGKTLWMHDYLRAHTAWRFFIVDHAAEWGPEAAHWRGTPPDNIEVFEASDALPETFPDTGLFVFRNREALDVARLVVEQGNATYVDDEIDFVGIRKGWEDSPLRIIVHQGRHAEDRDGNFTQLNIVGACRRPQSLHTDLTDIAEEVCIFRVQGSRTLERLKNDSHIEDEDWDIIRRLPKFHFMVWGKDVEADEQDEDGNAKPNPSKYREVEPLVDDRDKESAA